MYMYVCKYVHMYACMFVCMHHACLWCTKRSEKGIYSLEAGVTDGCRAPRMCWKWNPGPRVTRTPYSCAFPPGLDAGF